MISGTIPSQIGLLRNLQELVLYDNSLSGQLPQTIRNLITVVRFRVEMNYLIGLAVAPNYSFGSSRPFDCQVQVSPVYGETNCLDCQAIIGVSPLCECSSVSPSCSLAGVTSVRRQPVPTQPTTTTIKPPKPTLSPTTATATTKIAITEEVGHDRIPPTARKVEDATVVDSGNSTESTTRPNVDDNDNEDLTFSLIGGGVGAVFLVLLFVTIFLVVWRRRNPRRRGTKSSGPISITNSAALPPPLPQTTAVASMSLLPSSLPSVASTLPRYNVVPPMTNMYESPDSPMYN